jgi:hypothetical protein
MTAMGKLVDRGRPSGPGRELPDDRGPPSTRRRARQFLPGDRQLRTLPGSRVVRFADEEHSVGLTICRQRRRSDPGCTRASSKRARNEFECILSPDVHSFGATEAMSLLVLRSDRGIDLS